MRLFWAAVLVGSMIVVQAYVACIGECMIELSEHPDGRITRGFGGDTLNTAVYLARLGVRVDYVSALGDDAFSDELMAAWRREGIGTGGVLRLAQRMPGLYMIQTDRSGERRFSYWRDRAPAREIFTDAHASGVAAHLSSHTHLYFSGISLSLYGASGRARLMDCLDAARARGAQVVFDTNFRPRGWPDVEDARSAFSEALARASLIFASVEDLTPIYGAPFRDALTAYAGGAEVVCKLASPAVEIVEDGRAVVIPAPTVSPVVDTTAAGDSFAAAYLAARHAGLSPRHAVAQAHHLASTVVQHRGAIIPAEAMPVLDVGAAHDRA